MKTVLIDEWTGLDVERLDQDHQGYAYGATVDFDGRLWTVVKKEYPSSALTRVWIREKVA